LIDLQDRIPGVQNFTWKEALYHPTWGTCVYPTQEQAEMIIRFANKVMQPIRNKVGMPLRIHSWLRVETYNKQIGGAFKSFHIDGGACDFSVIGIKIEDAKKLIEPYLGVWGARMEIDTTDWVHVDCRPRKQGEPVTFYGRKIK